MKKLIYYVAILVITLSSCANPRSLEYQDVKNFKLYELSLHPQIGMDVQLYNPNNYSMELKRANIKVYINDKLIGYTDLVNSFDVPANDTFLLPVKMTTDLSGIFSNALAIMANKEVSIRLEGFIKAGRRVFINIPINYIGRQKLNIYGLK